jgi:hypothetical protein
MLWLVKKEKLCWTRNTIVGGRQRSPAIVIGRKLESLNVRTDSRTKLNYGENQKKKKLLKKICHSIEFNKI